MRIPSGDLAPARRPGRRGRHGYRRHHQRRHHRRRALPLLLTVLLLGIAAGVGYLLRRDDSGVPDRLAVGAQSVGSTPCPTPARARTPVKAAARPSFLPPNRVALRLLNSTPRDGLAKRVGDELARRGFRVGATGNAPRPLAGASQVYYGPGGRPAALALANHVIGAKVTPVPTAPAGSVDLVLGSSFIRLRTAAEVTEFAARGGPRASAATAPSPRPVGCA